MEEYETGKIRRDLRTDKLKRDLKHGVDYLNNSRTLIEKIRGVRYDLISCEECFENSISIIYEDRKWRRKSAGRPVVAQIRLTETGKITGDYSPDFKHVAEVIGASEIISFNEMALSPEIKNNPFLN